MEWLLWFTKFENTKPVSLVIFFTVFCLILYYLYGNKQRGQQLEVFKNIPFLDEVKDEMRSVAQNEIQDKKEKQS